MVQKCCRDSSQGNNELCTRYAAKLENRKAAGADQIVNAFMKYGGEGTLTMMIMLYNWKWKNDMPLKRWREGVGVNLLEKGNKADPGN